MRKIRKYRNMPKGDLTRVRDFLPPPQKLVMPQETIKVTIALNKSSVDFFKEQAKENHAKYQKMIRNLLERYTAHYAH